MEQEVIVSGIGLKEDDSEEVIPRQWMFAVGHFI